MIITSATTVTTVTYLNLYELEQYKKQFQSFWIPFMEQFIPATTIWVAGERWCNDVCTIIDPCDYDFELVEADVSIQEVPTGFFPTKSVGSFSTAIIPPIVNTGLPSGTAVGVIPRILPTLTVVTDLGLTNERPIIRTVAEASIDLLKYQSRFTSPQTERIIV